MLLPHHITPVGPGAFGAAALSARALLARTRRRLATRTPPRHVGDRLVRDPVFVLCASRSGSTLLRSILTTHSRIHAPHELHFHSLQVSLRHDWARGAFRQLELTTDDLEMILWDRLLYGLLSESGKEMIVDKTPQNSSAWERISRGWPHARYIHLRRHPAAIYVSRLRANPTWSDERNASVLLDYGRQLDAARRALPGPTVRYEDLTADPTTVMQEVCAYLGVEWEPRMLDYRIPSRAEQVSRVGDWSKSLRSGQIQPPAALPTTVPDAIRPLIESWGYDGDPAPSLR